MKRNEFLRHGILGLGGIVGVPAAISSCKKDETTTGTTSGDCTVSPSETKGPFPIKTPAELIRSSIIADRAGIPMVITLTIVDKNDGCNPMAGVLVDVWHCDKDGNYSEYGGTAMQSTDYTGVHFLRGRQTTDANGKVSFLSIYPGWYSSRAPHVHLEVLSASGASLLVSQIAFPENISATVYASSLYAAHGQADTANTADNVFSDSLSGNLATVTGNLTDGYTVTKTVVVNG